MPDTHIDKPTLIANIKHDRARLDELVTSLDHARLLEPALDGGWCVKDALAHITAWEQLCLKWIREGRREEGPFTQGTIDAFNRGIYETNRDRALDAVMADSRRSYDAIVQTADTLPDDIDAAPAWAPGRSLGEIISSNADEHYREHIDQIEAWLRARNA
jgi:hypothetical protein